MNQRETRPYYLVYAGRFGYIGADDTWIPQEHSLFVWKWWGHDQEAALHHLLELEQCAYDFCGLSTALTA